MLEAGVEIECPSVDERHSCQLFLLFHFLLCSSQGSDSCTHQAWTRLPSSLVGEE